MKKKYIKIIDTLILYYFAIDIDTTDLSVFTERIQTT